MAAAAVMLAVSVPVAESPISPDSPPAAPQRPEQPFYFPEPAVCPSTPAAHRTFLLPSPHPRSAEPSRPPLPSSPSCSTLSSLSHTACSAPLSACRTPPLSARTRRVYIKECRELRRCIRVLPCPHSRPSTPPASPGLSLASLQERYSARKSDLRQSAATAIQAAWRGYKTRKTHTTQHRRQLVTALQSAASGASTMEVDTHDATEQQPGRQEKVLLAATEVSAHTGATESAQTASERMDCMVNALVAQREQNDKMRQAVETWAVAELQKEKGLLKALLSEEAQAREQRRAAPAASSSALEDSELRLVFATLYAHYRYLQSLLAQQGGSPRPQVPLFHAADSVTSSHVSSAFSLVKPQASSPRVDRRALQLRLGEYTRQFTATHGRAIQSAEDIAPVKEEWARYKYLKFMLSEKGQAGGINRQMSNRVNGKSTAAPDNEQKAASVRGHRQSASMSTAPVVGATVSSAFSSRVSRTISGGSHPSSPQAPHTPLTPSMLTTQPNTPSTPLTPPTPPTPASGSAYPFASLYTSSPNYSSPSLLSSLPSPSTSPSHGPATPMLPPSPISPYSPNLPYPHSPNTFNPASIGMSIGGSFGGYVPVYPPLPPPTTAAVQALQPHFNAAH